MADQTENREKLLGYVCDNLCKYRDVTDDQDELDDICCECEIEELVDGLTGKEK